jgi:hypothetical protein
MHIKKKITALNVIMYSHKLKEIYSVCSGAGAEGCVAEKWALKSNINSFFSIYVGPPVSAHSSLGACII